MLTLIFLACAYCLHLHDYFLLQGIIENFGGVLGQLPTPMHGKPSMVKIVSDMDKGIFFEVRERESAREGEGERGREEERESERKMGGENVRQTGREADPSPPFIFWGFLRKRAHWEGLGFRNYWEASSHTMRVLRENIRERTFSCVLLIYMHTHSRTYTLSHSLAHSHSHSHVARALF